MNTAREVLGEIALHLSYLLGHSSSKLCGSLLSSLWSLSGDRPPSLLVLGPCASLYAALCLLLCMNPRFFLALQRCGFPPLWRGSVAQKRENSTSVWPTAAARHWIYSPGALVVFRPRLSRYCFRSFLLRRSKRAGQRVLCLSALKSLNCSALLLYLS